MGGVLTATVTDGALEAWFRRGALLTRLRVPPDGEGEAEDLVSGQQLDVLAVRQSPGATFTLTTASGGATLHRF
jgi:hypothetical protein